MNFGPGFLRVITALYSNPKTHLSMELDQMTSLCRGACVKAALFPPYCLLFLWNRWQQRSEMMLTSKESG